jgi:hypothetical protein
MTVVLQASTAQTYTLNCMGASGSTSKAITLALAPVEGACSASPAVRARGGKRAALRRKPTGSPS